MFSIYKDDIEWIMKEAKKKFPVPEELLLDNGSIFYNIGDYGTELEYSYHKRLCFSIQYKDDTPYIKIDILANNKVNVFIFGICDGENVCGRYKTELKCVNTTEIASVLCEIADKQGWKSGRCHIDDLHWLKYEETLGKKNTFFSINDNTAKQVEKIEQLCNLFIDNGEHSPFQEIKAFNYKDDCGRTATIISYKNVVLYENVPHLIKTDTLTVYESEEKVIDKKQYKNFIGAKSALKRLSKTWQEIK